MKISIILVVVLAAYASGQCLPNPYPLPPFLVDPSQEGILDSLKSFGKKTLSGLKTLGKAAGKGLISIASQILTDGLHLQPEQDVSSALDLDDSVSTEAIFDHIGNLIEKRARDDLISTYPSHEGIFNKLPPYILRPNAPEYYLGVHFNKSILAGIPSQEGILGNLGGFALRGLGGLIGGTAGNVISGAGDVLGSLFYALPPQQGVSQEGIISKLGKAGILTSSGQLVAKGATQVAKTLLTGLFKPYTDILRGTLFLARGQYSGYSDLQAPGKEALLSARNLIHHHNFSQANVCVDAAELNLTQLFNHYVQNSNLCANVSHSQGKPIVNHVFDIIIDAVKRVEDSHREASYCFTRVVAQNRERCLDQEVPALIQAHSQRFVEYGRHLSDFVRQFSDINTQFDVCLTGHLGVVRRDVYGIIRNFHKCVEQQEVGSSPRAAPAPSVV